MFTKTLSRMRNVLQPIPSSAAFIPSDFTASPALVETIKVATVMHNKVV